MGNLLKKAGAAPPPNDTNQELSALDKQCKDSENKMTITSKELNRKFNISVGSSRTSAKWIFQEIAWGEFCERCSNTKRTKETVEEYAAMSKDQQGKIKDVGGFVAGTLRNGKRKKENVLSRSMITLDVDFCEDSAPAFWNYVNSHLPFAALVYSSHSHTEERPRLRLIIPSSRDITPEEYEPIARKIAGELGINQFDDTTYQAARLMYWPSCPSDGPFFFMNKAGAIMDPNKILDKYDNWQDSKEWPHSEREAEITRHGATKVEDPTKKAGIVGTFCRAYSIQEAIEILLDDVYKPEPNGRYTYIKGESSCGLVCYEEMFAYSNHGTDPAHDKLCNAFDLVRIHKFGNLDKGKEYTDITRAPSYSAMCDFVNNDTRVKIMRSKEIAEDFSKVEIDDGDDWRDNLEFDKKNNLKPTAKNFRLILENDPGLKEHIWFNELSKYMEAGALPWRKQAGQWLDVDDAFLRGYVEEHYKLSSREKIYDALSIVAERNKRHPIREYLNNLKWDGVPRLDTMVIDYLGAEDTPLIRTITRKHFVAAVARIFQPGIKYDFCLTLTGPEETGKSSLFRIMGGDWFDDSITTIEGKEGRENLRGKWIIELAELSSVKRSEVATIKNFLSNQVDSYRAAYDRRVTQYPRQCVFCATTNEDKFLKGDTGNRRFWVIQIKPELARKGGTLSDRLDMLESDRAQIWAEATHYYQGGEKLYLNSELSKDLRESQEDFSDDSDDPTKVMLEQFLNTYIPEAWDKWDMISRREWINNPRPIVQGTEVRSLFCIPEFLCERMGYDLRNKEYKYTARKVAKLMRDLPDWEEVSTVRHTINLYGRQRGWRRTTPPKAEEMYEHGEDGL